MPKSYCPGPSCSKAGQLIHWICHYPTQSTDIPFDAFGEILHRPMIKNSFTFVLYKFHVATMRFLYGCFCLSITWSKCLAQINPKNSWSDRTYFSSVLDHCTLYPESHAFSHRSYCNSLLDCLSAHTAFHWPISSKRYFSLRCLYL